VIGSNKYVETLQQETSQLVNSTVVWQPNTTCSITDSNMTLPDILCCYCTQCTHDRNCNQRCRVVVSG